MFGLSILISDELEYAFQMNERSFAIISAKQSAKLSVTQSVCKYLLFRASKHLFSFPSNELEFVFSPLFVQCISNGSKIIISSPELVLNIRFCYEIQL